MAYRKAWLAALLAATLVAAVPPAGAQTVILVRHAEKAAEPAADPPLTPAGSARADALATALKDARLTHVVTSGLARTRDTAAPAARAAGVTPRVVAIAGATTGHVADTVALLKALPRDAVALVVGHSNTVPDIAAGLGLASSAAISDCTFDRLLVLSLDRTPPAAITARYGAPSNCPE